MTNFQIKQTSNPIRIKNIVKKEKIFAILYIFKKYDLYLHP